MSTVRPQPMSHLTAWYLFTTAVGFVAIGSTNAVDLPGIMYVPTTVVGFYAFVVYRSVMSERDRSMIDHAVDSIYFLGFLFTLGALVALFANLGKVERSGADILPFAMDYIGISVTTSLAGVLLRNIVRGVYLQRNPEPSTDSIQAFLAERSAVVEALAERERQYLEALDEYVRATRSFSSSLSSAETGLIEPVQALSPVVDQLFRSVDRARRGAEALPWNGVAEEMELFHTGVRELNEVLDGLITVLEHKVERVR